MKKRLILFGAIGIPIIIALVIMAGIAGATSLPRERFTLAAQPKESLTWDVIFAHPTDLVFKRIETGVLSVPLSAIINLKHENALELEDTEVSGPVYAYLVTHPREGVLAIDAGLDSLFSKDPYGSLKGILVRFMMQPATQKASLADYCRENDIEVSRFLFTHLHYDHCAGLLDFPEEREVIAGKGESYMNYPPFFYGKWMDKVEKVLEIDFSGGVAIPPFTVCVDIFGDKSIWAISTPGHTAGHVSYVLNAGEGPIFLTGDAVIARWSLDHGVGPGSFSKDVEEAQKSLDMIKTFTDTHSKVKVFCGHDD